MRFSTIGILCSLLVLPSFASPVETRNPTSLAAGTTSNEAPWISKRCCINCDNPYARCGSKDNRESVETEEEALFGPQTRCCINCDNSYARCKRGETPAQWPEKRCCINCNNPYARCDGRGLDTREAVDTLEEAVEGLNKDIGSAVGMDIYGLEAGIKGGGLDACMKLHLDRSISVGL